MTRSTTAAATALVALTALGRSGAGDERPESSSDQVRAREVAFAQTMADRDHAAFVSFVAEEALFLGATVLRGRKAVGAGWKPLFDGAEAPFSWAPERVEVVESGTLAISTGPVRGPEGERVGTYNSTWRLEPDGEWRVVLDVGCPPPQSLADAPTPPDEAGDEPTGLAEP